MNGNKLLPIPIDTNALPGLRRDTRSVLRGWDLPDTLIAVALNVVQELAANAITHTGEPAELRLIHNHLLRIEVFDASTRPPRPATALSDGYGIGTAIIDDLSDGWGHHPSPAGKTVWAEILIA